jgi:hypothetical protein
MIAVATLVIISLTLFDDTKGTADRYGNHASIIGLFVSIVGFALTVWTVLETLRLNTKSQDETRRQVAAARQETRGLLDNIRAKAMSDTCEQAYHYATEARHAIRLSFWVRAAERCQDARQQTLTLLNFQDLRDHERTPIRAVVEDLKTVIAFIERNRIRDNPPAGLPDDKILPVDSLIDELQRVRSRLQQQLMEMPNVN